MEVKERPWGVEEDWEEWMRANCKPISVSRSPILRQVSLGFAACLGPAAMADAREGSRHSIRLPYAM